MIDQRSCRLVLAVEIVLGVIPIAIVGGLYALMGTLFGTFSVLASIPQHSYDGFVLWFGILMLALGGLTGLAGLWLLVTAAWMKQEDQRLRRASLRASTVGVVTAVVTLALAARGRDVPQWTVIYLLVSPIVVVCHRAYADASVCQRDGTASALSDLPGSAHVVAIDAKRQRAQPDHEDAERNQRERPAD